MLIRAGGECGRFFGWEGLGKITSYFCDLDNTNRLTEALIFKPHSPADMGQYHLSPS